MCKIGAECSCSTIFRFGKDTLFGKTLTKDDSKMASAEVTPTSTTQSLFWTQLAGWLRAIPRSALLSMIGPSLLLLCGYFGWRFYGAKQYDATFHGINKANVVINDQPPWIKISVVDQVFDESGIDRLSLFDSQTPAIIARTFDAHPAIRKTRRVQPLAGGKISISAEYRIPVAMVCLQPASNEQGVPKWLPIDGESYILPTEGLVNKEWVSYFNNEDVNKYIWIFANDLRSDVVRNCGAPFNDSRIEDAALLCKLLSPYKDQLKIKSVSVSAAPFVDKTRWMLTIETKGDGAQTDGPRILWGSSPGLESLREPKYEEKLTRLLDIASDRVQWSQSSIDLTK